MSEVVALRTGRDREPGDGAPASGSTASASDESSTIEKAALSVRDFWYVVAESKELSPGTVLARRVLDEDLAVFRDASGTPHVIRDRCMHRAAPLSKGRVEGGCLRCPYHGWLYDGAGEVVEVPCERQRFTPEGGGTGGKARRALVHEVKEQDDFVYVRLRDPAHPEKPGRDDVTPFAMPCYKKPGYHTVRVQNRFQNNVTNCAENFIDIPHTVYVHPSIFRVARGQHIEADVVRKNGEVHAVYRGETDNLGWFRWFLNPRGDAIEHTDSFYLPNVTSVSYVFGPRRHFLITSQSVPVSDDETLVYTDLTYDYGIWNRLAAPIVRWQGQQVIDQDIEILKLQMDSIKKYGDDFAHTQADVIHIFVESIRNALLRGEDPRLLPEKKRTISFFV